MNMKQNEYRQGDVLLVKVAAIPEGAKQKDNVLALGEATGHHHTLEGGDVMVKDGIQYVVARQRTRLVHQEHGQIEIPKGKYKVALQHEYSPTENRRVMD